MKHLANCKPSEFLSQTAKIRKAVEKWIKVTDITNIRKNVPQFTDDMSEDEKKALVKQQAKENLGKVLTAALETHPEDTLEILALLCFVEPDDVDNYPMSEYILSILEMLQDESVVGFFTLLLKLGQKDISKVSKLFG